MRSCCPISQSSASYSACSSTAPSSNTAPSDELAVSPSSPRAVANLEAGSMTRAAIMAKHSATARAGCRPPCDSIPSSPSRRSVPRTDATWPCGKLRTSLNDR